MVNEQFITTSEIAKKIKLSTNKTLELCMKLQHHHLILGEMRDENGNIYVDHTNWQNRYAYTWSSFIGSDESDEKYQEEWNKFFKIISDEKKQLK